MILYPQVSSIPMFRKKPDFHWIKLVVPAILRQALSQPWMEGLGQSVGGMLTAAPGGGTGSDKADETPGLMVVFLAQGVGFLGQTLMFLMVILQYIGQTRREKKRHL